MLSALQFSVLKAVTGCVLQEKVFLEISQNSKENTCVNNSYVIKLQAEETASRLSRVFSYLRFVYFISTEKWEWKKGNILTELKYLLFCSGIDLFDVEDFKRNLAGGNLIGKCV